MTLARTKKRKKDKKKIFIYQYFIFTKGILLKHEIVTK